MRVIIIAVVTFVGCCPSSHVVRSQEETALRVVTDMSRLAGCSHDAAVQPRYGLTFGPCKLDDADDEIVGDDRAATLFFTIAELVLEPASYARCKDIFSEPRFQKAISRIAPGDLGMLDAQFSYLLPRVGSLDRTQLAMVRVLASSRPWRYSEVEHGGLYGCTYPNSTTKRQFSAASVVIYSEACDADTIYSESLGAIPSRLRVLLIASHELGHVIDVLTGDLESDFGNRESRATLYGTYFVQCEARRIQDLLTTEMAPGAPLSSSCNYLEWLRFELRVAQLRQSAHSKGFPADAARAFACSMDGRGWGLAGSDGATACPQ